MPNSHLTINDLLTLLTKVETGVTITLIKTSAGVFMVDIPKTKQQLIEEQFNHLRGQGITISEAAKKYDTPRGAVDSWVYRGNYISFVDELAYPRLIDEAEVALCAQIYHERQKTGLTGIPYFDDYDFPVTEMKHPELSEYRRRKNST